jgi:hypothetical protein
MDIGRPGSFFALRAKHGGSAWIKRLGRGSGAPVPFTTYMRFLPSGKRPYDKRSWAKSTALVGASKYPFLAFIRRLSPMARQQPFALRLAFVLDSKRFPAAFSANAA